MKHILTLLTLFVWSYTAIASDSTIIFQQISHSDLFEMAKRENKGVMLYFHFDGCGACLKMEKTAFKDQNVVDFCNTNFINFDINTLKGEGIDINKIYNIKTHPTFIFFDNKGNEFHRLVGAFSPEGFYNQAKNALLSSKNLTNYKKQYMEGNRESNFLFDFTYMLRDAYELDSIVVNEYLDAIDEDSLILEKNIKYIYEFCVHRFKIFIPLENPRFNFLLNNKNLFYEHLDSQQVDTRIVWILHNAIHKAIEEKDEKTFNKAIEAITAYDNGVQYLFKETDGRITGIITGNNLVLISMLYYYEKMGDHSNFKKALDTYISKIWNDADELNSYAWNIFEVANDNETEKIESAIKCSIRAIELNNNYAYNDTYAWLLYKSGNKHKALEQANKTIEIAKETNQKYSETQKLVDIIAKEN